MKQWGNWNSRYTYGAGVDEPLLMERGGSSYTYHRDALGSVTEISDSSGNLVERYEYDVYGQPEFYDGSYTAIAESAIGNPYLFTGRRYDPESGNYYYRARIYSPTLGRFLSMDPLGYGAGDANLYRYTFNNPANLTDPSRQFVGILLVGGLILGGITGFTYDVMVNQGRGGIENVRSGAVFRAEYYCGVRPFTENNYPFPSGRGWIVTNHFAIPASRSKRCSSKSIAFCVNFLPVL